MSLSLAFNTARSSLQTTATQLSVSSRNVAGGNDPNASRKIAVTITSGDGSSRVVTISRATGGPLFDRMLGATSSTANEKAVLDGLDTLRQTIGETTSGISPAAICSRAPCQTLGSRRASPREWNRSRSRSPFCFSVE